MLQSEGKKKHTDYLAELRRKREANGGRQKHRIDDSSRTIDQLMNDNSLTEYQKMEAVRKKADKLEEAAKRQEKLIQVAKIGASN